MAISAEFTADFTQFTAATAGATDALGRVKEAATGMAIDHQVQAAGTAMRDLGGQVAAFATDYIAAFAEEEAATARLNTALTNSGLAAEGTLEAYGRMATQFQDTTRFSDDAITAAQDVLTSMAHLGPDQMEPAITAAANLAAQLGIGIPEAAEKIAKVIASDGAKLGTLKTYLSDVDIKGKSAAEMIAIFNSKFGGAAAADMETTAGKLANLNNKFDDMKGKVGEAVANALTPLLDLFLGLPGPIQSAIVVVTGLGTALVPVAIAFGAVVTAIGPLVTLLGGAGGIAALLGAAGAALTAVLAPIALVVAAAAGLYLAFKHWDQITAFCEAVYTGIKTWLVDRFTALVGAIRAPIDAVAGAFKGLYDKVVGHSYVPDMLTGIASEFAKLDAVMVAPTVAAAAKTEAALEQAMSAVGELAGGALAGPRRAPAALGGVGQGLAVAGGNQPGERAPVYGAGGMLGVAERLVSAMIPVYGAGGYLGLRTPGAGGVAVTNTFNIVDTEANLAQRVSDTIMRSVTQARRV